MSTKLNPEKGLLFRIVHVDNVPWILRHGIRCRNSDHQDPDYIDIGSASLIEKRSRKRVPIPPGGTLSDYVPFYFTPWSIMMFNIHTGYGGVTKRNNKDIIVFVTSVHRLHEQGLPFVFTDQHAYAIDTEYFNDIEDLTRIDWALLQSRNFKTDDADPGKQLRYQAEALVHEHLPVSALLGTACYDSSVQEKLESLVAQNGHDLTVKTIPKWYF